MARPTGTRRVSLGFTPRAWQDRCFRSLRRFSVMLIHRRAGKTVFAIMLLIDRALGITREGGQFAYIAPELKQAKRNAWGYLKSYATKVPGTKVFEAELCVVLPNGSKIWLFGADNPDSLRGIYLDGAVLDELAQMKPQTWGEIVSVALMDRMGWALFIGTVKGVTLLSELYHKALKDTTGTWYAAKLRWQETQVFKDSDIALARMTMTPNQFRQELECDESAATDNQLIPFDLVMAAMGKHLGIEVYEHAPKVIGVDVARSETGDRSVIFKRQGLAAFAPWMARGVDNMTLAGLVAKEIGEWGADACFIDAGRGEGVIDRLRQMGYDPIPVQFGGTALQPHYQNKRAEMWDAMGAWLREGGALPDIPELAADLCAPTFKYQIGSDRMQMETKDQLKERGLPSPDLGDALACTFAFPVAPKPLAYDDPVVRAHFGASGGLRVKRDDDPYYRPFGS